MPKKDGGKGKDIMGKSPGDASRDVRVPSWRGEDGYGGDPQSKKEESSSVNYDR